MKYKLCDHLVTVFGMHSCLWTLTITVPCTAFKEETLEAFVVFIGHA